MPVHKIDTDILFLTIELSENSCSILLFLRLQMLLGIIRTECDGEHHNRQTY